MKTHLYMVYAAVEFHKLIPKCQRSTSPLLCQKRFNTYFKAIVKESKLITHEFSFFFSSFNIIFCLLYYSEVLLRPQIVLVESGLNSDQVSLTRPIYIEKCILVQKQVVLIVRVVLIWSGLYSGTLQYFTVWFSNIKICSKINNLLMFKGLIRFYILQLLLFFSQNCTLILITKY